MVVEAMAELKMDDAGAEADEVAAESEEMVDDARWGHFLRNVSDKRRGGR
jgi:hypothetical protein